MHIAAARGHEAIVQLLRHGGATLDAFASLAMRFKVSLSQCICLYLNLHSKENNNTSNKCKQSANWAPVGSKIKPIDSKSAPIWGPWVAKVESFLGAQSFRHRENWACPFSRTVKEIWLPCLSTFSTNPVPFWVDSFQTARKEYSRRVFW